MNAGRQNLQKMYGLVRMHTSGCCKVACKLLAASYWHCRKIEPAAACSKRRNELEQLSCTGSAFNMFASPAATRADGAMVCAVECPIDKYMYGFWFVCIYHRLM